MSVNIKTLPDSRIELHFIVDVPAFNAFLSKAAIKLSKDLDIKGFRKGHIPEDMVKQIVGDEGLLKEATHIAVSDLYRETVAERNLEPIGSPEVEILKQALGNEFEFRVRVQVMPEILLPDYKAIASSVERQGVVVSEEEVEESLRWLQKSRAKFSQVARACEKGDFVEVEFENSVDKKKHKDAFILGEGRFVLGFEDNIAGMQKDESKNFCLRFPSDYPKDDLRGREVCFTVWLQSVQKMDLPALDEDFAKNVGNFESTANLKSSIRQGIETEKNTAESYRVRDDVLARVEEKIRLDIPQVLLHAEQDRMLAALKEEVWERLKISFDEYLSKSHQIEADVKKSLEEEARKKIKRFLVLREIAKKENIQATEAEIEEEVAKYLRKHSVGEKARKDIDPSQLRAYIEDAIRTEKILARIEKYATK